jgi:hypothetical protein
MSNGSAGIGLGKPSLAFEAIVVCRQNFGEHVFRRVARLSRKVGCLSIKDRVGCETG